MISILIGLLLLVILVGSGGLMYLRMNKGEDQEGESGNENDCVYSDYGEWSPPCPTECDATGTQERTRTIVRNAYVGGKPCDMNKLKETRDCEVIACPGPCKYSEWSGFGQCSNTCGKGTHRSTRTILREAVGDEYQDEQCDYTQLSEMEECVNLDDCNVPGYGRLEKKDIEINYNGTKSGPVKLGAELEKKNHILCKSACELNPWCRSFKVGRIGGSNEGQCQLYNTHQFDSNVQNKDDPNYDYYFRIDETNQHDPNWMAYHHIPKSRLSATFAGYGDERGVDPSYPYRYGWSNKPHCQSECGRNSSCKVITFDDDPNNSRQENPYGTLCLRHSNTDMTNLQEDDSTAVYIPYGRV